MTRDELRKFYTFLKKETGVDGIPSRSLGSKEEVLKEIRKIIEKTENTYAANWIRTSKKYSELLYKNTGLRFENNDLKLEISKLKSELEELKNKKWWQIWKGR